MFSRNLLRERTNSRNGNITREKDEKRERGGKKKMKFIVAIQPFLPLDQMKERERERKKWQIKKGKSIIHKLLFILFCLSM